MKPIVTRLYAILVALTLVGLIAWAGADWYQLQQRAEEQGRATLRQAAGWISELTVRHAPLDAATLGKVFSAATANGRWKMILLSSSDRGTEFYKGPRPSVPVEREVPRWEPKSFSEVKLALPVFRSDGDPMVLEGITEFYGRNEVFSLLKACGVTLLVLLVLTTLVVILSPRFGRSEEEIPDDQDRDRGWEPDQDRNPRSAEPQEDQFSDALDTPEETIGTIALETDDEYWFDDNLTLEDLPPLEGVAPLDVPPREQPEAAPVPAVTPVNQGPSLFSPHSGLGWESFLTTRLDFELERSSTQNQDLALILLSVKDGSASPAAWGSAVLEAFPLRDLDFETEDGAAVVLPSRTLEQALKAARTFVEQCERTLGIVVHAGVAARSGRLLSAETLLGEAASARRRSLAGTVRVLGLKTDPDRYREHLASATA